MLIYNVQTDKHAHNEDREEPKKKSADNSKNCERLQKQKLFQLF